MPSAEFDPARMLGALHASGVRFVLIGGMAAVLHGDAKLRSSKSRTASRSPSLRSAT